MDTPLFLALRSSRHESNGRIPAEMYLGKDLPLPLDLLRGSLPNEAVAGSKYVARLREKLYNIHDLARKLTVPKTVMTVVMTVKTVMFQSLGMTGVVGRVVSKMKKRCDCLIRVGRKESLPNY